MGYKLRVESLLPAASSACNCSFTVLYCKCFISSDDMTKAFLDSPIPGQAAVIYKWCPDQTSLSECQWVCFPGENNLSPHYVASYSPGHRSLGIHLKASNEVVGKLGKT